MDGKYLHKAYSGQEEMAAAAIDQEIIYDPKTFLEYEDSKKEIMMLHLETNFLQLRHHLYKKYL